MAASSLKVWGWNNDSIHHRQSNYSAWHDGEPRCHRTCLFSFRQPAWFRDLSALSRWICLSFCFIFGSVEWCGKPSLQPCSTSTRGQLLNWRAQSALFSVECQEMSFEAFGFVSMFTQVSLYAKSSGIGQRFQRQGQLNINPHCALEGNDWGHYLRLLRERRKFKEQAKQAKMRRFLAVSRWI